MEYNKGYGIVLAITNGYLTFGFYILRNWIEKKTKLNVQSEIHHVVAFTGFVGCIISGYSFPGNACFTLTCEVSSIFLNFKDMFSKESRMSLIGQINQLMFLITFTIFRMIPFPYLVMRSGV